MLLEHELAHVAARRFAEVDEATKKAVLTAIEASYDTDMYELELLECPATGDAAEEIRRLAPDGVDVVVEIAPAANAALDQAVLAPNGTVAAYATDGGNELELSVRALMSRNVRYQFVLVYTVPAKAKDQAVADVVAAVAEGALPVGEEAGLPLHRFPLERTADAHAAVEGGAVGKVLIDVG